MVTCLERGANDLRMVQMMPLPPHHLLLLTDLTSLTLAYPGCTGKDAIECMSRLSILYNSSMFWPVFFQFHLPAIAWLHH